MPPGIGNTGLGTAQATIVINTSQLKNALSIVRTTGSQMSSSFSAAAVQINNTIKAQTAQTGVMRAQLGVLTANIAAQRQNNVAANVAANTGTQGLQQQVTLLRQNIATRNLQTAQLRQQQTALQQQNQTLNEQRNNSLQAAIAMSVLGAAAARVVNAGVATAGFFEQQAVAFAGLTGSLAGGLDLMEHIRSTSQKMKVPFNEMVEAARSLLPTLEGDTAQLDKYFDLVRRVAALNPVQGIQGAGFSINEALTSGGTDLRSLANRFNIPRNIFKEEMAKSNNDFAKSLDATLNRMGVTTQVADRMGKTFVSSFNAAKDASLQLLGEGFRPLLELITPKITLFTNWVIGLRQAQKEALGLTAAIISVVGVGVPVAFFLGKWISAFSILIGQAKTFATTLNPSVLKFIGAAGLYAGAAVGGAAVGKYLGNKVQESRGDKPSDWGDLWNTFKEALFIAGYGLIKAAYWFAGALLNMNGAIHQATAGMLRWYASFLDLIGATAAAKNARSSALSQDSEANFSYNAGSYASQSNQIKRAGKSLRDDMFGNGSSSSNANANEDFGHTKQANGYSPNQEQIIDDYFKQIDELTDHHNQELIESADEYGAQRTQVVQSHDQEVLREEQDFATARLRQEQDYQHSVAMIQRDSSQQIAQWNSDLAESIAKEQQDSNAKLADIERKYIKDREQAEKEHRLNLLEAAANLDAKAVWQEQKSYKLSSDNAESSHKEQIESEKKNVAEKIASEIAENAKRIERSKQNDAQRLSDMALDFAKHKQIEDEDRKLKLARQQEDYTKQLSQMDAEQGKRMAKLNEQYAKEKLRLEEDMRNKLKDEGLFGDAWLKNQNMWQDEALKRFKKWFKDIAESITPTEKQYGPASKDQQPQYYTPFATGGYVSKTGLALLHKGETVVNASNSGKSINIHEGAIQVHASPGMNESYLAKMVRDNLIDLLEATA